MLANRDVPIVPSSLKNRKRAIADDRGGSSACTVAMDPSFGRFSWRLLFFRETQNGRKFDPNERQDFAHTCAGPDHDPVSGRLLQRRLRVCPRPGCLCTDGRRAGKRPHAQAGGGRRAEGGHGVCLRALQLDAGRRFQRRGPHLRHLRLRLRLRRHVRQEDRRASGL